MDTPSSSRIILGLASALMTNSRTMQNKAFNIRTRTGTILVTFDGMCGLSSTASRRCSSPGCIKAMPRERPRCFASSGYKYDYSCSSHLLRDEIEMELIAVKPPFAIAFYCTSQHATIEPRSHSHGQSSFYNRNRDIKAHAPGALFTLYVYMSCIMLRQISRIHRQKQAQWETQNGCQMCMRRNVP